MKKLRVAVVFGGRSGEHEVSAVSARHVVEAMDPERYEVLPVAIDREGRWILPAVSRKVLEGGALEVPEVAFEATGEPVTVLSEPGRREIVPIDPSAGTPTIDQIDIFFPVLHGPYGEDGTIQGLFEMADVPYVGSGVLGSALGMDKEKMKMAFRAAGLPTCKWVSAREVRFSEDREALLTEIEDGLGYPCFTKPANLGSSVGIVKCSDRDELSAGLGEAFRYDRKVIVEEAVEGREIECGVLGNDEPEASVCGEVVSAREFYDYEAKYVDDASEVIVPADLPDEVCERVREAAVRAFLAVNAEGLSRVDFFYEEPGRGVLVNEVNTMPGFTPISMYPKLWAASGVPYPRLIDRLIDLGLERYRAKKS